MNTIAIPLTNNRRILHHSATRRKSRAMFALRQDRAINSPGSQEFASNGEVFALFVGDQIARTPDASATSNATLPVQPAEYFTTRAQLLVKYSRHLHLIALCAFALFALFALKGGEVDAYRCRTCVWTLRAAEFDSVSPPDGRPPRSRHAYDFWKSVLWRFLRRSFPP